MHRPPFFDLLDDCYLRLKMVIALRDAVSGKRLATGSLVWVGGRVWRVGQVRTFANREAEVRLYRIAAAAARRANVANDELVARLEAGRVRLTADITLHPAQALAPVPYRGRVAWLDETDWVHAVPWPGDAAFAVVVAEAHGGRAASAQAWRSLEQSLWADYPGYLVFDQLLLREDDIPAPEALLPYLAHQVEGTRFEALDRYQASLTQPEWDHMRQSWIQEACVTPDRVIHRSALVLRIEDEDGRQAWLRGQLSGDDLGGYYLRLEGLFQYRDDAIESIRREVLPEAWLNGRSMWTQTGSSSEPLGE